MNSHNQNTWLVLTPYGDEDLVECRSFSFDGGSLICFRDDSMKQVVVAYSPGGWLRIRGWSEDDQQIQA